jgi:hypothetical protein
MEAAMAMILVYHGGIAPALIEHHGGWRQG